MPRFKLVQALWWRQRMELLPGPAPVPLLARTKDTVVGLTDLRGYPDGFVFVLRVRWGHVADPMRRCPGRSRTGGARPAGGQALSDQLLRFGLQVPDGRQVTNMDMYPFVPEGLPPDQPVLVEGAVKVARAAAWAGARSGTWS